MNALLAEAEVDYCIVKEMYETKISQTPQDDDPNSPIAGMPICEVWKGKTVILFNRGVAQATVA